MKGPGNRFHLAYFLDNDRRCIHYPAYYTATCQKQKNNNLPFVVLISGEIVCAASLHCPLLCCCPLFVFSSPSLCLFFTKVSRKLTHGGLVEVFPIGFRLAEVAYQPNTLGLISYRTTFGVLQKTWIRGKIIHFPWLRSIMLSNGQLKKMNWPLNVGKAHSSEWSIEKH